jgi:AraC-like DNA-binding protein
MQRSQILWVARSYTLPQSGVKKHSHPYYHLFYIHNGEGIFALDEREQFLRAGDCLLVPPEQEHAYRNETDQPLEYLEIKFTLSQDTQLRTNACVTRSRLAGLLVQQILKEYSDLGSLADSAAESYLSALLSALTETNRYSKPRSFRYIDASAWTELSQRIITRLENHYDRSASLEALAADLGYNKSYLCEAFKKDTGLTILDCLNTIRIRRAAELIVYSDHSLTQVADLCGFSSVSHFNRVFLKYAGITPGQCRRAYPANALFESAQSPAIRRPDRFMYSVLAQKTITPEMIRDLDSKENQE